MKPFLILRSNIDHPNGKAHLYISNKGLGPAIFKDFQILYDGKYFDSTHEVFSAIRKKMGYNTENFNKEYRLFALPLIDYSITPDEEKTLIKYHLKNNSSKESRAFYKEFTEITFFFRYTDFYEHEKSFQFKFSKDFHGAG